MPGFPSDHIGQGEALRRAGKVGEARKNSNSMNIDSRSVGLHSQLESIRSRSGVGDREGAIESLSRSAWGLS
mgnify:CR=1 FL=1